MSVPEAISEDRLLCRYGQSLDRTSGYAEIRSVIGPPAVRHALVKTEVLAPLHYLVPRGASATIPNTATVVVL